MKNLQLLVISVFALVQVHQANSWAFFGGNQAPAQPAQSESHYPEVAQNDVAGAPAPNHQVHQAHQGPKVHQGQFWMKSGHSGNGFLRHQSQFLVIQPLVARNQFYEKCGISSRHCDWVARDKHMHIKNKFARTHQQQLQQVQSPETSKHEMDFVCWSSNHVCVGDTETCISNRSCDVAARITEMTVENNGKTTYSGVVSVSSLNNCNMDAQSVTDGSTMPQMLFALGFATYDESGQNLECRNPKASDFKLVFLWKNSTEGEAQGHTQICTEKPKEKEFLAVKFHDHEMMQAIASWPAACNAMEKKEESFNLKSFLTKHVPATEYTSFFSAPFDFADNYEPKYSSNGMVISGTV